jgi:hypothetical protein
MGITGNDIKFLSYAQRLGVSFENTLTLGRLYLYLDNKDVQKYVSFEKEDGYSEALFYALGAKQADSMDYSDYEGASVIHDLNKPIPDSFKKKYSVIVDGGTIEHVFNFPVAIKNCMEMLKVGGHYIGITPANNSCGHGFYQFSPELYYTVFNESNGFKVKLMVVKVRDDWYETTDPSVVRSRVELTNAVPVTLFVVAQKMSDKPIFEETPQQSDYTRRWNAVKTEQPVTKQNTSGLRFLYYKLPSFYRKTIRLTYVTLRGLTSKKSQLVTLRGLGKVNPLHYKKIDIN